jgi:hypothetical protein
MVDVYNINGKKNLMEFRVLLHQNDQILASGPEELRVGNA